VTNISGRDHGLYTFCGSTRCTIGVGAADSRPLAVDVSFCGPPQRPSFAGFRLKVRGLGEAGEVPEAAGMGNHAF
jgi:hypothetical protein